MGSTPLGPLYPRDEHEKQSRELLEKWQASGSGQRTLAEAQEAVAREHDFDTWARLIEWVEAAGQRVARSHVSSLPSRRWSRATSRSSAD